jgi:tetratricopeptide (TPR) repeat protein
MSDVLNGHRVNLPDWRFVYEFVTACRAAAAENGLDVAGLGTVADWKRHWDGATNGVIDARFPGHSDWPGNGPGESTPNLESVLPPGDPGSGELARDNPGNAVARPGVMGPMPASLPDFTGRQNYLTGLRGSLAQDETAAVTTIHGLPGAGKTQLAVEYVSRYGGEYDLVWWVPCGDAAEAREAMAALAVVAGTAGPPAGTLPGGRASSGDIRNPDYAELFDLLRGGERYGRWLLVFDGANEPEELRGIIPPGSTAGRVLVTTRNVAWETYGDMVELDVFDRAESVEFLRRRMRRFSDVDAHLLAEETGDLPLLLEHAVESGLGVGEYLERLESEPLALLSQQPADYHSTITSVWETAVGELRAVDRDAFDLLRCLAFFGNGSVPRESFERSRNLPDVSIHGLLDAPIRLARAIAKLRRTGLLRLWPGPRSLLVHRVTRLLVRDLAGRSDEAERFRHDVHVLLAAADPLTPDDPAAWPDYEELRAHVAGSGAVDCQQEMVRKFMVNLVRYLNAVGDPRAAVSLAEEAVASWETGAGDDRLEFDGSSSGTDCRATMRVAKASALLAQGRWPEAFRLCEESLAGLRAEPERWAAEILDLEAMSGAKYRIEGDFAAAQAADEKSARIHAETFGAHDPRTFSAINRLATDLALNGLCQAAVEGARTVYRNCIAFYGDASHPAALAAWNVLGRCQWRSGDYGEAAITLTEVHRGFKVLADRRILAEDHPLRLAHEIDYAVARRDKGLSPDGLEILVEEMHRVRRQCWRSLGADHPQTIAAAVVLASILRRMDNHTAEAVRLLEEAGRRYEYVLGPDHPYTLGVRANADIDFTPLPL